MNKILFALIFGLLTSGCNKTHKEENTQQSNLQNRMPAIDEMSGSKIDVLIRDYGLPDMIEPASKFNAKFVGMESASVVLTYIALGRHVYVRKDCTIIIVIKISK